MNFLDSLKLNKKGKEKFHCLGYKYVGNMSHAPICKNNLMLFKEHCVIFYAKFVIDQLGLRIINVIHNILFINK